jgi:inorganic pyrophosphatase
MAAGEIKDKADRDSSLVAALHTCRAELEDAKRESDAADKRFEEIKHVYNLAT